MRNQDLLAAFQASLGRGRREEEELLVAPAYLHWLCSQIEGLAHAEVCLKRGLGDNEMNRYRYDAVLRVGQGLPPVRIEALRTWDEVGGTLEGLARWLEGGRPLAGELLGVPNARLGGDGAVDPESLWTLGEHLDTGCASAGPRPLARSTWTRCGRGERAQGSGPAVARRRSSALPVW